MVDIARSIDSYLSSLLLSSALESGLIDEISNGSAPPVTGKGYSLLPSGYERIIRALVAMDVVAIDEHHKPQLTQSARFLIAKDGKGNSVARDLFQLMTSREVSDAWRATPGWLGEEDIYATPWDKAHGLDWISYYENHPIAAEIFSNAMAESTRLIAPQLCKTIRELTRNLDSVTILDVGGCSGELSAILSQSMPGVTYDVFDLEHNRKHYEQRSLEAPLIKSRFLSGNFFEDVPPGYSLYVLKFILHDWDESDALRILENVRHAVGESRAKVLVIEASSSADQNELSFLLRDLHMLAVTGGRERNTSEWTELFQRAHMEIINISNIGFGQNVFEVSPC